MAFPQGINLRRTEAYRSGEDAASSGGNGWCYPEPSGGNNNYPQTTAQGNSVGWETTASGYEGRNRSGTNDVRLAGMGFDGGGTNVVRDFRVDLSGTGDWSIRIAMGDGSYARDVDCEILDTSSSLGVVISGATSAGNNFKDATDTNYTAANWPGSNSAITKTFSTTICRFRVGAADAQSTCLAHVYLASAGGAAGQPTMRRFGGVPGMGRGQSFGRSW